MVRRVVWSAVLATALGVSAVVASIFVGLESTVIALGFSAVTAALLANRER